MILSDASILEAIARNDIVIEPYDRNCLGTNSYDVHLSKYLACYIDEIIDARKHNPVEHFEIGDEGIKCSNLLGQACIEARIISTSKTDT